MVTWSRADAHRRAFTLMELLVVFAMIAIAGSIAYPSMRSVLNGGAVQYATGSVEQVRAAELSWAASHGQYTNTPGNLRLPASLESSTSTSSGPDDVSIAVGDDGSFAAAALANDGTCVAVWMSAPDPVTATALEVRGGDGDLDGDGDPDELVPCSGAAALDVATSGAAAVLPASSQ